jgi:hypothetical protein
MSGLDDNGQATGAVEKGGQVDPPAGHGPAAETPPPKQEAGDRTAGRPAARPRRAAKPASSPEGVASEVAAAQTVSGEAVSKPTEKPAGKRPPAKRAATKTAARAAKPAASTRKAAKPVASQTEVTRRRRATVKPVEANLVEASAVPESPGLNGQPAETAQAEAPARQPVWDARLEVCQIGWWRGYVKSQFYAEAIGPDGDRYGAGTSPTFRWWRNAPPAQTAAAVAAHEALVAKLLRAGWERDDQGLEWYEARFCRVTPRSLADRLARVRGQGSPIR